MQLLMWGLLSEINLILKLHYLGNCRGGQSIKCHIERGYDFILSNERSVQDLSAVQIL